MKTYYAIPGGFVSFLIAFFIRLWAFEHGYRLLGWLATIYMAILLVPVVVILIAVIVFALFIIFGLRRSQQFDNTRNHIIR